MKLRKLQTLVSINGNLKSAKLLVDEQFNNFSKRPKIKNLEAVNTKNTYRGWVVKYQNGSNLHQELYGFLVSRACPKPNELVRITANGKKDRVIYFGKNQVDDIILGMGNLHGEPTFLSDQNAFLASTSLGIIH